MEGEVPERVCPLDSGKIFDCRMAGEAAYWLFGCMICPTTFVDSGVPTTHAHPLYLLPHCIFYLLAIRKSISYGQACITFSRLLIHLGGRDGEALLPSSGKRGKERGGIQM